MLKSYKRGRKQRRQQNDAVTAAYQHQLDNCKDNQVGTYEGVSFEYDLQRKAHYVIYGGPAGQGRKTIKYENLDLKSGLDPKRHQNWEVKTVSAAVTSSTH